MKVIHQHVAACVAQQRCAHGKRFESDQREALVRRRAHDDRRRFQGLQALLGQASEIDAPDDALDTITQTTAPTLREASGIGADSAGTGTLMGTDTWVNGAMSLGSRPRAPSHTTISPVDFLMW